MAFWILEIAFTIYLAANAILLLYGLNCYVLLVLFLRSVRPTGALQRSIENEWNEKHPAGKDCDLPRVTTQLPLYNELNVAERAIRAIAALDYPKHLHQIQVLDDSTDETRQAVDRIAEELKAAGIWIDVFRRERRQGYKAGALNDAMPSAHGEFIAIFDSDFIPAPGFLHRLLPHLADEKVGLVQARWGHINREESLLTRAQAMAIDGHFTIEQTARAANRLFLNFNGTAGIWRRATIEDAGGWTADTLTEDLDLSYRAQLRGWRLEYVSHVLAPAELPNSYSAFRSQQFRWAKGSIQTSVKLLRGVIRSDRSYFVKLQATLHLCHYFAHPLMLVIALLALPALQSFGGSIHQTWLIFLSIPLLASTLGPASLYLVCQRYLYPTDWLGRVLLLPVLMMVGFGICISNTRGVIEALTGVESGFVRTPKTGSTQAKSYRPSPSALPILEILAGIYCLVSLGFFFHAGYYGMAPFLLLYAAGFFLVGGSSLREQKASSSRTTISAGVGRNCDTRAKGD